MARNLTDLFKTESKQYTDTRSQDLNQRIR